MNKSTHIVVFTADFSHTVRKGIVAINQAIPDVLWLIVINCPVKKPIKLLRNQWHNLRRNGLRWIPHSMANVFRRLMPDNSVVIESCQPGYKYTSQAFESLPNVHVITVPDLHGPDTIAAVHSFSPRLGLSLAAPILKRPLFSIPDLGTLNLHKGKVPDFRGMPPAFWELWNDVDSIGCTVHWIEEKLDTGDVVKETTITRLQYSTLRGLQLTLDEIGITIMKDAVVDVLKGNIIGTPQASGGKTYRKPTLGQIAALQKKIEYQCQQQTGMKQFLKDSFFQFRIQLQRAFLHKFSSPKITVLLFHRVTDEVRDNLTVGIEQFDRQMALVRKYYHVLSIEQVATSERIRTSGKSAVCITFDDGYLDNYVHAVPILLKYGIPAAFFVSTGIIDTNGTFPHDRIRGNENISVMNWEQIRTMHEAGFTIGSHTVSHIDCASESEELVRKELKESMMVIHRELGIQNVIFAYPYGGRQHMTPERLQLVKQAGYSACLSAYGGSNFTKVDRFNVKRNGVHYEFSDVAFHSQCEGYACRR